MIVVSFASNNPVAAIDLPALISSTHSALRSIDSACTSSEAPAEPAVPVEESITHDYLIGLNDGEKLRALERYLQGKYSRSEQYREKWGLPSD